AGLGGSPVPASVAERARELGISLVRSYGSTEHPSITGSSHDDPEDKRLFTDGHPLPGVEVRLVDENGRLLEPGNPGVIESRGPDLFVAYTDPDLTARAVDDEGWYSTGDIGVLDGDGYLRITDRVQDVIIRGGENISAAEVEDLLLRVPGIAEAAVVAAPDRRMGEHACAFLRMEPGAPDAEMAQIRAHLEAEGLARQKWPEELRTVAELPRTPSSKVKKVALRDQLRSRGRLT
ncbi:MAG: AMP-binding protein, partial [Thermoplasmata archaeon]